MKLKKDIHNLMNRNKIYAHAGDEVKIIGAVLVMAKKDGIKFSVRAEDLEENPPVNKEASTPKPEAEPVKKKLFSEPMPKKPIEQPKQNNAPSLF